MSIKYFCRISILISILFFVVSLYFYKIFNVDLYFEKALTLTFSALGSIGTIASIIFAIWLYNSQKESQQPIFLLSAKDPMERRDELRIEPYWAIDINIINYGHQVTSFSLVSLECKLNKNIIIDIADNFKTSFNKGESHKIRLMIYNSIAITDLPKITDLNFTFSLNYLDVFNTPHFDEYKIDYIDGKKTIRLEKLK